MVTVLSLDLMVMRETFRPLNRRNAPASICFRVDSVFFFIFTLVPGPRRSLSLRLSDRRVYEPRLRARLVTKTHFTQVFFGMDRPPCGARSAVGAPSSGFRVSIQKRVGLDLGGSRGTVCPLNRRNASASTFLRDVTFFEG